MVSRPRPDRPEDAVWRLLERVDQLETMVYGRSSSVTNGRTRFAGNESVLVEGSGKVSGWWIVTGTLRVVGTLQMLGNMLVEGIVNVVGEIIVGSGGSQIILDGETGDLTTSGNTTLGGTVDITGDVTLDSDLSVGSGRITVGSLSLDRLGGYGGRILSSSTLLLDTSTMYVSASTSSFTGSVDVGGNALITGSLTAGVKYFAIPHPAKPGKRLLHGSLEGPEHGVFYRGRVTFDDDGEAVFALPDYFDALVLDDDAPTVMVTPVGAPFPVGADDVTDGAVTVYGAAGRSAHVVVIGARGRFDVEADDQAS